MDRVLKCQWCDEKDRLPKEKSHPKGYIHIDCIPKYESDKRFKEKEREELDSLVEKIAEIHELNNIQEIPSTFFPYLQELRNASVLFGKVKKNFKQGVPYKGIEFTYDFCRNQIEWARKNKEFKNTISEMRYCLAIVRNSLSDAYKEAQRQKMQEKSRHIDRKKEIEYEEKEIKFNRNKNKKQDISEFL